MVTPPPRSPERVEKARPQGGKLRAQACGRPAGPRKVDGHVLRHVGRPGSEHEHPVGEEEGLVEVVGHQDHGGPMLSPERFEHLHQVGAREGVHCPERFIQKPGPTPGKEGACECRALAHAAREGVRVVVLESLEAVTDERGAGGPPGLGSAQAGKFGTQGDVVEGRPPRHEGIALRHQGEAAEPRRFGISIEVHVPAVRRSQAGEHVEQRALSAPRRPHQRQELTRCHVEGGAGQHRQRPVGSGERELEGARGDTRRPHAPCSQPRRGRTTSPPRRRVVIPGGPGRTVPTRVRGAPAAAQRGMSPGGRATMSS